MKVTPFVTFVVLMAVLIPSLISQPSAAEAVDFKTLRNPVPNSRASIATGKTLYLQYCTECHGADGKAQVDAIADAIDLTEPEVYYSGISEGEIFHSIRDGAGVAMPPWSFEIEAEADVWHMVNFIRSLWPADQRPRLAE